MNKSFLFNGECVSLMRKELKNNSIDLIVTDPPYGVGFKTDLYDDSYEAVLANMPIWFNEWYRVLKEDCYLYLFVGVKTLHIWIEEGIKAGFTYKNIIATRSFNNGAMTPKNNFGFQFQPVLVFSKGKGKNFNDVDFVPTSEEWFNDKRNLDPKPFTYAYPNWIKSEWCFATAKRSTDNLHPNEKNVELIQFLIEISSNKEDVVLDNFLGCGSTALASVLSDRNFIGMELNKDLYDLAVKRIKRNINIFNYEKLGVWHE